MTDTSGEREIYRPQVLPGRAKRRTSPRRTSRSTPQTEHPAYRLAFRDADFILRDELRPVRFQLELLKTEMLLEEANVGSTLVFYGSARIPPPEAAATALEGAKAMDDDARRWSSGWSPSRKYYPEAYNARAAGQRDWRSSRTGKRQFVVCSGGGPSIMEAANKGASDADVESIGLNIVLPHEQAPNPYVTPNLSFQFHYFALRKMHFLLRAQAVAVFPGGFGTFDETFELLTLIQTGKMKPIPILLFGEEFWNRVINFKALCEEGTIGPNGPRAVPLLRDRRGGLGPHRGVLQHRAIRPGTSEPSAPPGAPSARARRRSRARRASAARTKPRAAGPQSLERLRPMPEIGRDRAREGAAGAVGVAGVDARRPRRHVRPSRRAEPAGPRMRGPRACAALGEDRRTPRGSRLRRHRIPVGRRQRRQLRQVGRGQRREPHQRLERGDGRRVGQHRAAGRDHHRVEHDRDRKPPATTAATTARSRASRACRS